MMHTYSNSFHNTSSRSRYSVADFEHLERVLETTRFADLKDADRATYAARQRLWRALCGHRDCTCSDSMGRRA